MSELTHGESRITDNLDQLLQVLPPDVRLAIQAQTTGEELLEIVLDLGRQPEARYTSGNVLLTDRVIDHADLEYVTSRVGEFGKDNRAGIERTLHRISAIRNRTGRVVGLTCRIGRAVFGTIDIMRDVVESGKSILILGRPGVGKTTKLREVARVLSEEFGKRVVIVDTSNEIAGDGDIPHPAIGRARRMQVPEPALQHAVMIEAVENHMPEVVIIDEIGTEQEAFAARTIAERGVQLVGTAHGNTLENLMMNPTLSDLIGGIQPVTLSDEEARRRGTQKTVLERKAPPTFDVLIEMIAKEKMALHEDVSGTVDNLLRGRPPRPEIRERTDAGAVEVIQPSEASLLPPREAGGRERVGTLRPHVPSGDREPRGTTDGRRRPEELDFPPTSYFDEVEAKQPKTVKIFPFGVSRNRLENAIRVLRVPATLTRTWDAADVVIALKAHYRRDPGRLKDAIEHHKPTFVVRSNTQVQIESVLREMFGLNSDDSEDEAGAAMREAEEGIARVLQSGEAVELLPQNSYVRRLQHELIRSYSLASASVGSEPYRRIRITRS
ncbi:MAG: R3H domain-containing nucleic acid-binding protein [Armatimonadota bacterium]